MTKCGAYVDLVTSKAHSTQKHMSTLICKPNIWSVLRTGTTLFTKLIVITVQQFIFVNQKDDLNDDGLNITIHCR